MSSILTVILTGGSSSRMGRDKAMLPLEGSTMSQLLIDRYSALGGVAVSVNEKGRFPCKGAIELVDRYPGQGPLNGLVSAFEETDAGLVFLTATDIPNGDPRLTLHLLSLIGEHDCCVINTAKGLEPLFSLYKRACLPVVIDSLESGRRSIHSVLSRCDTLYVEESRLSGWDLDQTLLNVNTPEEYRKLKGAQTDE